MNSSKKKKANEFSGQYKTIPEQQLCQTSKGFCLHWGNRLEAPGKISRERKQRTDQYPDTSKCNENSHMDSVGEGEGGKIWENGIETCKYHV